MKKFIAYMMFTIACLGWGAFLVLPALGGMTGNIALWMTVSLITAEAAFLIGIALLGKEAWRKFKSRFRIRRNAGAGHQAQETPSSPSPGGRSSDDSQPLMNAETNE